MTVQPGDPAPRFSLGAGTGETISTETLQGQPFVLYFYPKDHTRGCTIETREFGNLLADFQSLGVRVFGCSIGDAAAKADFAASCGAPDLPLLADPEHAVASTYGAWKARETPEGEVMGVARTTFLVGRDGRVARRWDAVVPEGHAGEVLVAARGLSQAGSG